MSRSFFPRSGLRSRPLRSLQPWLIGVPLALIGVLLLIVLLRPDAATGHFRRAQSLQAAGQLESALRLYELIVETQPDSAYAPLALQQEGEILTALARQNGDADMFRKALATYDRLARQYPTHSVVGQALMEAGSIALNDLRDTAHAARFYQALLDKYSNNADYTSEALLRLGRIALLDGDGAKAQNFFNRVLKDKDYARFPDRTAEAQYHQGVVFETLLKNKSAARNAYEATIKKWPHSVWAGDAKERLGMMAYSDGGSTRPARRVVLEVRALPPMKGDSRSAALRLVLAARGLEIGDAIWRGWSLAPFRAGFSPEAPGRVLTNEESDWKSVAANAGLIYSQRSAADAGRALNLLRDELDAGHAPLINAGGWRLVAGYDSARDEFTLRAPGADAQTLTAKELAAQWRHGGEYTLLAFEVPGERPRAAVEKAANSTDAPALLAPTYLYKLPRLPLQEAHRRALRRAAALMLRPRTDTVLLNLEALRALRSEIEKLGHAPVSPVPAPEAAADETEAPPSRDSASPAPASTPPPRSDAINRNAARWKTLKLWFGAPLKQWIAARRDAAAYLDAAAGDLDDPRLERAAAELRAAINALNDAASTLPADDAFISDPEAARRQLQALAEKIGAALDAEKNATSAMKG